MQCIKGCKVCSSFINSFFNFFFDIYFLNNKKYGSIKNDAAQKQEGCFHISLNIFSLFFFFVIFISLLFNQVAKKSMFSFFQKATS